MKISKEYLFFNHLKIKIPPSFKKMDEQFVYDTYPIVTRSPKEVFANYDRTVTVSLNLSEDKIKPSQLKEFKDNVFVPQFTQPSIEILQSEIQENDYGDKFIIFSFIAPNLEYDLYNLFFITSITNKMFLGAFNCPASEINEWEEVANDLINSLEVV